MSQFTDLEEWGGSLHKVQASVDAESGTISISVIDKSGEFYGSDQSEEPEEPLPVELDLDTAEQFAKKLLEWVEKARV